MGHSPVIETFPLGFQWPTLDPFLFCVHHDDAYPPGNDRLGPQGSLAGRALGQDFEPKDGWRMYHGRVVPGFPQHPHRGFETVTIVRRGLVDHADSLGATARYGEGDVQWLTAGAGIVHSEMFPLLRADADNPAELFQIWINLHSAHKMAAPHFTMFWGPTIPAATPVPGVDVRVIAGALGDARGLPPPPDSWASNADADVAIWTVRLGANATWTLPPARGEVHRVAYFFAGESLRVAGVQVAARTGVALDPSRAVELTNGPVPGELLILQGRPIGEPVVQMGPFVMNTRAEIQETIDAYRKTGFGGWPWPADDPVHARAEGRFAKHADGRVERPPG